MTGVCNAFSVLYDTVLVAVLIIKNIMKENLEKRIKEYENLRDDILDNIMERSNLRPDYIISKGKELECIIIKLNELRLWV